MTATEARTRVEGIFMLKIEEANEKQMSVLVRERSVLTVVRVKMESRKLCASRKGD